MQGRAAIARVTQGTDTELKRRTERPFVGREFDARPLAELPPAVRPVLFCEEVV